MMPVYAKAERFGWRRYQWSESSGCLTLADIVLAGSPWQFPDHSVMASGRSGEDSSPSPRLRAEGRGEGLSTGAASYFTTFNPNPASSPSTSPGTSS
jgi:hypothetical protein